MKYSKWVYIYLLIIFGSYFIIVLYMLQENVKTKSQLPEDYNRAHIENDMKIGILYHHKRHTGLPNYFNNTALPVDKLDASVYYFVQRIINDENFHPLYQADISVMSNPTFHNEDLKDVLIVNENSKWIKIKFLDSHNNQVYVIPKFYDFDFVLLNEDRIKHPREKHFSYILSFYLSRLLSLTHVPLAIGRRLNFSSLIKSSPELFDYVFENRGLRCMSLECAGCYSLSRSICVNANSSVDSALVHIPVDLKLDSFVNPLFGIKSDSSNNGCAFSSSLPHSLFLDIVDHAVFEFLTGSQVINRQLYLAHARDKKRLFFLDNGYGFGNPFVDNLKYLHVLQSCCKFHRHLVDRLQRLSGGVLSRSLKLLVSRDELAPLLSPDQLHAIDRRLHSVLNIVKRCISHNGLNNVLL